MNRTAVVIGTAVAMLVVFVIGAQVYQTQQAKSVGELAKKQSTIFEPAHAMTWGPDDARVTVVEFFDPACETCAAMAGPVHQLLESHEGRVRLVYRYAPFHPGSEDVVKMLEGARKQDLFVPALKLMFASQSMWASHHHPRPQMLWEMMPRAGVDVEQLRKDVTAVELDQLIAQDVADAKALGVRKTPTYFVNGKSLPSFGFAQLKTLLEAEIAANY